MVIENKKLVLSLAVLVFSVLVSLNLASAWVDCYQYSEQGGGTPAECVAEGCVVTSETGLAVGGVSAEDVTLDPWCGSSHGEYCCLEKMCWQWDATGQETCEANDGTLNCTWNDFSVTNYYENGSSYELNGTCHGDWTIMGDSDFGGAASGCWQYDGDRGQCASQDNSATCEWKENDANQNPWCWIKTLGDAQMQNSFATTNDIGCCDMKGCWSYDGDEDQCVNGSMSGLCEFMTQEQDPWCPNSAGCCYAKSCSQVGSNETLCDSLKTQMMMPCDFNVSGTSLCEDFGGGGFMFFDDTDSCMTQGGWWNSSGGCEMPSLDGSGDFMFADGAHCWFADNQPDVCKNITGCIYCNASDAHFNVSGTSGTLNESSACYQRQVGYCQGHQLGDGELAIGDILTNSLNCTHIQIKSACEYGPLPNCKWENSSTITGAFCGVGTSSVVKSAPPVGFCEHPDAVNNYTLCMDLKEKYMMPCKWGNASANLTLSDNCTFNSNAVFGSGGGEKEFEIITSEFSCIASGGTWKKEFYLDSGLKQDSWCEKGALFNLIQGTASANKGNCDLDCWACEFQSNGSAWSTQSNAELNCTFSALGYCRWTNDTNAMNGHGWCDYPNEMSYGAGDCQTNCKDCGLQSNAHDSCINSIANCKWVNNTDSDGVKLETGSCVAQNKKVCETDCFSCYSSSNCFASSTDCYWDDNNILCKPNNFDGEICFDGMDNDNDGMMDCADPDCSFDTACGGSSFGDCAMYDFNLDGDADPNYCNDKIAFGGQNCTWINNTWESFGHCGMPGENCWQFDNNLSLCGLTTGCTNSSDQEFDGFCDMNMTKIDVAQCWNYDADEGTCSGQGDCRWVNDTWSYGSDGRCEYYLFAQCINMDGDADGCQADGNCTWFESEQICDPACREDGLDSGTCGTGDNRSGICEWRNSSMGGMCMPEFFDMMGGSSGAMSGCAQYDGNYTACIINNYTCVWHNDSNVDNNVSGTNADGWCDPKGEYELNGEMQGEPIMLGMDGDNSAGAESGINSWVDIMGFGMKVTSNAYGFGIGTYNISDAALCNGYPLSLMIPGAGPETSDSGTGLNSTNFRWYLDTDGSSDVAGRHCNATNLQGTALPDYEFYIDYIVQNNTDSGSIQTTKKLYVCAEDNSVWQWTPTNVFITDNKKFTCFLSTMGSPFVSIEKESLENFDLFDITSPLKIFALSSDMSNSSFDDEVGPAYYTPGTIDFDFVDCSNPNVKDPKCKSFQKFGFQGFEDCKNTDSNGYGIDDDGDGLANCFDPKCVYTPVCATGTAFDFDSGTNDNQAPTVSFSKVEKMAHSAIVKFDTSEPANGTLVFYNQSSTCTLGPGNSTLNDLGSPDFTFDDYKPFHRITLDENSLGFALTNGTIYYYKVKVCDTFGNCGTSSCWNFTTRKTEKNFIFRMDVPDGYTVDIPVLNYSGNFTYANTTLLGSGVVKDIGIKTNVSLTSNMNITVNYSDLSIKFVGADVYKPTTMDLEGAFIVDTTNKVLGMNSSSKSWNLVINDLGMGGDGDYLELDFSVPYNVSSTLTWYDDDLTTGSNVDAYTNCSSGGSGTVCKVPTSLGFSAYQLVAPTTTTTTSTTSSPGGSGLVPPSFWTGTTYVVNEEQFVEGYTKDIAVKERMKVFIDSEEHYVGVKEITETTAKIEVSSEPVEATLFVGDKRRFDVTGNGYYDIAVTLLSIYDDKANIKIISINEEVTAETIAEEQGKEKSATEDIVSLDETSLIWLWILIVVVLVIVGFTIYKKRK